MGGYRKIDKIKDLDDVSVSSPATSQILVYNPTTGKWENDELNLSDLTDDVTISSPANRECLVYDSGSAKWENMGAPDPYWTYLSTTSPTGTDSDIKALYQFDGGASSLTDRSSNSNDLTKQAGDENYTINNGLTGLLFEGTAYYAAAAHASYRISTDLTVEVVMQSHCDTLGQNRDVLGCGHTGGAEADNYLYRVIDDVCTAFLFQTESGAQVASTHTFDYAEAANNMHYLAITRNSAATGLTLYLNGSSVDTGTVTACSGGTSSILRVGAKADGSADFKGVIYSVRISAAEFSAAQVTTAWKQIRGIT